MKKIKEIKSGLLQLTYDTARKYRKDLVGKQDQVLNAILQAFTTMEIKKYQIGDLEYMIVQRILWYSAAPKKSSSIYNDENFMRIRRIAIQAVPADLKEYSEEIATDVLTDILRDKEKSQLLYSRGELEAYVVKAVQYQCSKPAAERRSGSPGPVRAAHYRWENLMTKRTFVDKKTGEEIDTDTWLSIHAIAPDHQADIDAKRSDDMRDATNRLVTQMGLNSLDENEKVIYTLYDLAGKDRKATAEKYSFGETEHKLLSSALRKLNITHKNYLTDYRGHDYKTDRTIPVPSE